MVEAYDYREVASGRARCGRGRKQNPGYFPVKGFCSRFDATKFPVRPNQESRCKYLTRKGLLDMARWFLRAKSIFFPVFPAQPGKSQHPAVRISRRLGWSKARSTEPLGHAGVGVVP